MSDIIAYILVTATVVVSGYGIVRVATVILQAVYLNQSLVLAFPFV